MDYDKETGEVLPSGKYEFTNIDDALSHLLQFQNAIKYYRGVIKEIEGNLLAITEFRNSNTSRLQGERLSCKIERPTKIVWDQNILHSVWQGGRPNSIMDFNDDDGDIIIPVPYYKVNIRKYKKLINTTGDIYYNNYKNELMSANLGVTGSPRFTIE